MNYRHGFHAGNVADVLKHAVLAVCLVHLGRKDKPFRVIDTHAGRGFYDLNDDAALRTGEWVEGIGRLWGKALSPPLAAFLEPLLGVVRAHNPDGALRTYPGSPAIAAALTRRDDRLVFCELQPQEQAALSGHLRRDPRVKVLALDGWLAPAAFTPPPEKRGLVIIDPPFEIGGEEDRLIDAAAQIQRRWRGGTVLLWYPIKDDARETRLIEGIRGLAIPQTLGLRLITRPDSSAGLRGSGLIIINPPFQLEEQISAIASDLLAALAAPEGALTVTPLG